MLTGDTLFVDGIGRPDLADEIKRDAAALYRTLQLLARRTSATTWVLPAHCKATAVTSPSVPTAAPIGEVLDKIAELGATGEEFVERARHCVAARPANYHQIVELNRSGTGTPADAASLEIGPNRCAM